MNGILIFGGTGSLGRKLIERMSKYDNVAVYSRDEAKHWTIRNELIGSDRASQLKCYVGDVRDKNRVKEVINLYRPHTIIIAAALKQVDTCELSPNESVMTNLIGTQNIIDAVNDIEMAGHHSHSLRVRKVLFVSTDKACSPVNVYGMCKALSERIVTSQSINKGSVKFLVVRYGNVLESRGSIIPLFKYQAEHNEYLTVTHPDMTRYIMTLDDSVDLIEHTLKNGEDGETWIPILPAMRIGDLAQIFADRYNKKVKVIGLRPGEKMNEDLVNESESIRTSLISDKHYVMNPAYIAQSNSSPFVYNSGQTIMSKDDLEKHLMKLGILSMSINDFHKGPTIEEIMTNRKE